MHMRSKNIKVKEKIGAELTEGYRCLLIGCLGVLPIVRGIDHIAMRGLQAVGRFTLQRGTAPTVGAHHAIEHRHENVQNENAVYDKTF